jgi:hypothetical protein
MRATRRLQQLGMEQYESAFVEAEVEVAVLPLLTSDDLQV